MNNIGMYFDTDDIADGRLSPVQRKQIAAMCKERSEKEDNIMTVKQLDETDALWREYDKKKKKKV